MRKRALLVFTVCVTALACIPASPASSAEAGAGKARENIDILQKWDFLPDVPRDEYAPVLELRGDTRLVEGGPAGLAVEVPYTDSDRFGRGHGAFIENNPALFPDGEFSLEVAVKPGEGFLNVLEGNGSFYLINTMNVRYVHPNPDVESKQGYMMQLRGVDEEGEKKARIIVYLGFGRDESTPSYATGGLDFEPGKWHHIVFVYDGEGGGKIYLDGENVADRKRRGWGSPLPSEQWNFFIGDRQSATRAPFPGRIGPVRLHHRMIEVEESGTCSRWC